MLAASGDVKVNDLTGLIKMEPAVRGLEHAGTLNKTMKRTFVVCFVCSRQNCNRDYGIWSIGARVVERHVETATLKAAETRYESFEITCRSDLRDYINIRARMPF